MTEIRDMNRRVIVYSLVLGSLVAVLGGLLFQDLKVSGGIYVGVFTGILGYMMIVRMTLSLGVEENASKKKGAFHYVVRYILYGLIFIFFVKLGFSVIACLVGFLCHKASILLYAIIEERKDKHARD